MAIPVGFNYMISARRPTTSNVEWFRLKISNTSTVSELKDLVLQQKHIPKDSQKLMYGGRLLEDRLNITDFFGQKREVELIIFGQSQPLPEDDAVDEPPPREPDAVVDEPLQPEPHVAQQNLMEFPSTSDSKVICLAFVIAALVAGYFLRRYINRKSP